MPIQENLVADLAHKYISAEVSAVPIEPIRTSYPEITVDDAYRIQQAVADGKVQRGDRIIGKKIGATTAAAQQKFGLSEPFFGYLLESARLEDGATVELARLIAPRVECEITFVIGRALAGPGVTVDDVLDATESVVAAFEIVDSRTKGWDVGMPEALADGGLSARFVLGRTPVLVQGRDLAQVRLVLTRNGAVAAESTGAAVMGSPAIAVAWLANKLATYNLGLEPGDIVLAGSLTPLQPVEAGDRLEAAFEGIGSVSVTFA